MRMVKKKVCLLGQFGVGKTSLIEKFVFNVFSEKYLSTIGVKVDKKEVVLPDGRRAVLMVWDLAGQEEENPAPRAYLKGMSGYLLVADGTRPDTLEMVRRIHKTVGGQYPDVPFRLLINKSDLTADWKISPRDYEDYTRKGVEVHITSAKEGTAVEDAFVGLAGAMLRPEGG